MSSSIQNDEAFLAIPTLSPDDEAFLISFFTMLIMCIEENPIYYYLRDIVKKNFEIDTIPAIQDIPRFITDPQVILNFNKKKIFIQNLYNIHIKPTYDKIMLKKEWLKEQSHTLRPSNHYNPLSTFNFGSRKQENAFDSHFNKNSQSAILLLLDLHGGFVQNPVVKVMSGIKLNKYSNAATGQCSRSTIGARKYVLYAICDTVNQPHGILDIPVIIKEGYSHAHIQPPSIPSIFFENTKTNLALTHKDEMTAKYVSTAPHSGVVGEEITYGNSFFEKMYQIDETNKFGVFLCSIWGKIGGRPMDNLLSNHFFIDFMNNKYEPEHKWRDGVANTRAIQKYYGIFKQLLSDSSIGCIKRFVSSDLFEFCEKYGKPEISLVDTSCSTFYGTYDGEVASEELTKSRYELYDNMNDSKNASVAKGIRKKSNKRKLRVLKKGKKSSIKVKSRYGKKRKSR